jgi:hypothetical protein
MKRINLYYLALLLLMLFMMVNDSANHPSDFLDGVNSFVNPYK